MTQIVVEYNGVDDGSGHSGDFDVTFQVSRRRSGHCSSARMVASTVRLRLTMKNRYPLPLIEALPSWLKCQFRQENVRFLDRRATYLGTQIELVDRLIS